MKDNIWSLDFQMPFFCEGQNMTIRLSKKWMKRKYALITVDMIDRIVPITCEKWANFDDMMKRRGIADHHLRFSEKQLLLQLHIGRTTGIVKKTPIYTITFNIKKEWIQ